MNALAMHVTGLESVAQIAVSRVLNSLPEGLMIALSAWILLRLMGRQNAGTRFAVWLVALLGVCGLPLLSGFEAGRRALSMAHADVTVSGHWAVLFVALWIPVAALALARVIAGVWQVSSIRKQCTEVDLASLDPMLHEIMEPAKGAGKHRRVRLLTSENARVPAAIGFFHAAVVMPAWCLRELTADDLKPILIHELAHLRRGDDWTNLLQKAARAVLFFHPAVWWIDARLAVEREMACDDAVLAQTGNPRAYAGTLIGLLERSCARRGWTMAQAAVAQARDAAVRIARILEGKSAATTRVGRGALGLAAAACMTCCGLLAVTPQFVEFAPEAAASARQASIQNHGIDPAQGAFRAPAIVPALYRPEHQPMRQMIHKAVSTLPVSGGNHVQEQAAIRNTGHPAAPRVVMAKLNEPTRHRDAAQHNVNVPAMPLLMVVETAETGYWPPLPTPVSAEATQAGAVPASAAGVVEIHTLQVLEQDETGSWQVRIYRVVTIVPATVAGSMHSSI